MKRKLLASSNFFDHGYKKKKKRAFPLSYGDHANIPTQSKWSGITILVRTFGRHKIINTSAHTCISKGLLLKQSKCKLCIVIMHKIPLQGPDKHSKVLFDFYPIFATFLPTPLSNNSGQPDRFKVSMLFFKKT